MSNSSVRPLSNAMRPFAPGNAACAAPGDAPSASTAAVPIAAARTRNRLFMFEPPLELLSASGPLRGTGLGRQSSHLGRPRGSHRAADELQHLLLAAAERGAGRVLPHHRPEHPGLG